MKTKKRKGTPRPNAGRKPKNYEEKKHTINLYVLGKHIINAGGNNRLKEDVNGYIEKKYM